MHLPIPTFPEPTFQSNMLLRRILVNMVATQRHAVDKHLQSSLQDSSYKVLEWNHLLQHNPLQYIRLTLVALKKKSKQVWNSLFNWFYAGPKNFKESSPCCTPNLHIWIKLSNCCSEQIPSRDDKSINQALHFKRSISTPKNNAAWKCCANILEKNKEKFNK